MLSVGQRRFGAQHGEHVRALHWAAAAPVLKLVLPLPTFGQRSPFNRIHWLLSPGMRVTLRRRIYCFAWRNPISRSTHSQAAQLDQTVSEITPT